MRSIHKHIATVLIGIFILPVLIQSVHIMYTHADYYDVHTHITLHQKDSLEKKHSATFEEGEELEHCLICEYEFAINSLPEASFFECIVPRIRVDYDETVITKPSTRSVSIKSPRAPPLGNA